MKQLRIHCFQHVAFEGLGYIETWANQCNHMVTSTKFFESYHFPELANLDWLIVMGGPMGVYETDQYPWLSQEKEFIKKAIDGRKIVIGICLGSQLIASALGAKVYPNTQKEIGWFPLSKTKQKHNLTGSFPDTFTTLHWHGDTFDLPTNAVHLLQTDICPNQAFVYEDRVLGLQFHLEVTPKALKAMIENCRHELIPDEYIQTEEEIQDQREYFNQSNRLLERILDKLFEDH
ncbi:MAG: type 1 glutamine amidotransferase [Leadbetterella sp.]